MTRNRGSNQQKKIGTKDNNKQQKQKQKQKQKQTKNE